VDLEKHIKYKKKTNMNQNEPEYALKIFNKANFIKDNEKGSRVLTEIKIQPSLNHEHIVKYEHSFEDKKNVYILIGYCGKGTLATLLNKRKHLEGYEMRYFVFQVLSLLKIFSKKEKST
jgi:serine/threonine protein kinase